MRVVGCQFFMYLIPIYRYVGNEGRSDREKAGNKQCTYYVGRSSLKKTPLQRPGCKWDNNKLTVDGVNKVTVHFL